MANAFDILVELHRPMLLSYARALHYLDADAAEDVVQEALRTGYQRLDSFRQGEDFGRWMRGIVRNKALESHRSAKGRRVVVDSRILDGVEEVYSLFDVSSIGEESWRERMERRLRHCTDRLSDLLKSALLRVYEEGMTLREAASAENASSAAVAQRLSRARNLVRTCVERHLEEDS